MLDRLSIPRRALDFEDYVDIVRRNIRWIVAPAFAGVVITTVVAFLIDDTFTSQAIIRVVPQQIAGSLVASSTAQDVSDRINSMAQSVNSRNTLSALISQYGLYKSELKSEPMEDVLTKMKEAIVIRPTLGITNIQSGRNIPAMQVQFSYRDRFLAAKVCSDIVSRFMSESSASTLSSQVGASTFMQDEFQKAKTDLDAAEQKLQDYRIRNQGKLPEQMQANMAQMAAMEQRLSSLTDAATRNSEKKMLLDTQVHIAKDRLASIKATPATSIARSEKAIETERDIEDLQSRIASMKDKYTDDYPDLQEAKDRLAVLKRQRDESAKAPSKGESGPENPLIARERQDAQAQVEALQANIKAIQVEDSAISSQIGQINGVLRGYEARIQEAPAGEKEYTELQRDRDSAKLQFDNLQAKMKQAEMSLNMERQKQGETLELLDNASTPTTPTKPQRAMIIPVGLIGGLILGFVLVAIREVRDTSLKNLKDARLYTQLSILGSIPLLENDVVVQRRKQVMWVGWATATVAGIVVMAVSIAHYYLSKS